MEKNKECIQNLKEISKKIRKKIVTQVYFGQSGHLGGALSCADVLTVLYFNQMNINVENKNDQNRDKFVLSKGHASAALYACLAEKGFINKEELKGFRKIDSFLQGHPDMKSVPGVEMTTGSLGQGLSASNGMAIAGKLDKKDYRVYCMVGDGELEEGQIWEALMTSVKYKLDNLCVIVDNNNLQIDGEVSKVKGIYPLKEKFESFGFNCLEINGHNLSEIIEAFENVKQVKNKPSVIIAKTIKGKGVSFMENKVEWHGKAPNKEEYNKAILEIENL